MTPMDPLKKDAQLEKLTPAEPALEKVSEEKAEQEVKEQERLTHEKLAAAKKEFEASAKEDVRGALDLESASHLASQTAAPANIQLKSIQDVMQEDIYELYVQLSASEQKKFAAEGKITAGKIQILLNKVKVNVSKIIDLLRRWLSFLPGINKYFLEQETKIKLDKLLEMKKREDGA
ncbi:MAG TPA: hypothetical protein VMX18_01525 [Candidatus Bipolaricaulota bacterium]|nr:hypothetical protein [Candidatus Bipolaricaulota bacterium]